MWKPLTTSMWAMLLSVGTLVAQQPAASDQQPNQPPGRAPRANQADQTEQRQQTRQTQQDQQSQQSQQERRSSQRVPIEGPRASEQMEQMAAWLATGNHAEIELGKLALEKSQRQEVRQFAQMMIEDHTKQLEKLKQFMPQPGIQQEGQARQAAQLEKHHGEMMQVGMRAAQIELKLTKDMLQDYEGQDFDMGYLGQQLVAHVEMLATLHAMKDQGSTEFQKLVQEGVSVTEKHMQHARQLAHRLEDKEAPANR